MALSDENLQVLNLVQAMIGAVTPNLRRVTLEMVSHATICLRFVLARDDPDDRAEIEDIAFEFEALQSGPVELDVKVIVDARPVNDLDIPGRVVFGRKE